MRKAHIYLSMFLLLLVSCTTVITVDIPDPEDAIVVEGSIENGEPPYVLLTRNSAFFGGIDLNDIESYFVRDAQIKITSNKGEMVVLTEFCLNEGLLNLLTDEEKRELASSLGYDLNDSTDVPNVCIYTIPNIIDYLNDPNAPVFKGKLNTRYDLEVIVEDKTLTSTTLIPNLNEIVSLSYRAHSDPSRDSLVSVYLELDDPDTAGNFIRYWTQRNDDDMYAPVGGSVFDDLLFNGQQFSFPVERGQDPEDDIDLDTYSYFWRGDTVVIKLASIDNPHYDFWLTIENDNGDSPFSAPTKIRSNIEGGLGIWGGYAADYDTIIIPQ